MTDSTKRGLGILAASLLLGVLGEWLLWGTEPGLNLFLWISFTVGALLVLARQVQTPLTGEGRWLLLPAVLLAGGVTWRASPALLLLDLGAMAVCMAGAVAFGREGQIRRGYLLGYILGGLSAGARTSSGLVPIFSHDIRLSDLPRGRRRPPWSPDRRSPAAPFRRPLYLGGRRLR